MVATRRISGDPYQMTTELVPVHAVGNIEKTVPPGWINAAHSDVTAPFLQYARLLVQVELPPFYIDGLTEHIHL